MIYFIYGNQSPTIRSQIKKIATSFLDNNVDEFNFVRVDGFNIPVQDAVSECQYVSLGYDKKVVSLENCYFLTKGKAKNKIDSEQDFDCLLDYLENGNDDSCLFIISAISSSLEERNKIVMLLKEKAKVILIEDPDEKNFIDYIRQYCDKYAIKIDNDAINELANRTNEDVALFRNSIDKLSLYTDHITYNDVTKMVTRQLEDNAFLISNYLLEGKNIDAVNLYKDLKSANVEPIVLIAQLGTQFRKINQVRYLLRTLRKSPDEAAREMGIKVGAVYAVSKQLSLCSEKAINRAIEDLYTLDSEIKSGLVDRFYAFELFLIKFNRN